MSHINACAQNTLHTVHRQQPTSSDDDDNNRDHDTLYAAPEWIRREAMAL